MWGYFGDFVSLLRNVPEYRDLPLAELMPAVFPDLTFVRVIRADKLRQAVSLWKAVQTATWREDQASAKAASVEDDDAPPTAPSSRSTGRSFASTIGRIAHLLEQLTGRGGERDAFFEHCGIKPVLVLYENFAADYETSTLNLLDRLSLSPRKGFEFEPRMKRQSDKINDDWVRRYSDLRLGTDFDLFPVPAET